jgi:hypothetical protein
MRYAATGMLAGCWSTLGFYRGQQCWAYKERNNHCTNTMFHRTLAGYAGVVCYIHPLLFLSIVTKEVYRFEVTRFGLERDEKYYTLF